MIVAITGSRDNVSPGVVQRGLAEWLRVYSYEDLGDDTLVEFRCGDARGVDLYARDWLRREGYIVDVYCASDASADRLTLMMNQIAVQQSGLGLRGDVKPRVVARTPRRNYRRIHRCSDWQRDGKQAGNIRNAHMLQRPELAHLLLKFHDGTSPGTRNCADVAERLGIEIVDGVELAGGVK